MNISIKRKKLVCALLVVLIIIVAAITYFTRSTWLPVPDTTSYHEVDFTFTYPRIYHVTEYGIDTASLGKPFGDTYTPLVEVVRYDSDPQAALPPSYDDFVRRQAIDVCGSDSSIESITCTATSTTRYTSAQGLSGKMLTLTLTRKNLVTATTTTMAYGPFYAFNMTTKPTNGASLRYSALFVYPSLEAFVVGTSSPQLLQNVIDTFAMPKGGSNYGE